MEAHRGSERKRAGGVGSEPRLLGSAGRSPPRVEAHRGSEPKRARGVGSVPAYLVARVEAHVLVALLAVVVRVIRRVLGQPHPRRLPPREQVVRPAGGPSVCRRCQRYRAGLGPEEAPRSSQRDKPMHCPHGSYSRAHECLISTQSRICYVTVQSDEIRTYCNGGDLAGFRFRHSSSLETSLRASDLC